MVRLIADNAATEFLFVTRPMYEQILNNSIGNLRLASLRDSLLPRLMSGKIDVADIRL